MPYLHRCDFCNDETRLSADEVAGADFDRSCDDCGEDGCINCMPDGVCDGCQSSRDEEDADTLDDDDDDDE